jgi:hypothetical protein
MEPFCSAGRYPIASRGTLLSIFRDIDNGFQSVIVTLGCEEVKPVVHPVSIDRIDQAMPLTGEFKEVLVCFLS